MGFFLPSRCAMPCCLSSFSLGSATPRDLINFIDEKKEIDPTCLFRHNDLLQLYEHHDEYAAIGEISMSTPSHRRSFASACFAMPSRPAESALAAPAGLLIDLALVTLLGGRCGALTLPLLQEPSGIAVGL